MSGRCAWKRAAPLTVLARPVGTSPGPAVQLVLATFASLAVAVGRRKRVSRNVGVTVEKPDGSSTAVTVNSAVAGTFCGKRVSASRSSVFS